MKEKVFELKKLLSKNTIKIEQFFGKNGNDFELLYDNETELFNNHFPFVIDPYYYLKNYEQIKLQTFYKSHNLIFTAYQLLLTGNYGASNMMMRGIFEYLMIGKYFSVKPDFVLADRWLNGNQFDTYDKAIKYLEKSKKDGFHKFWCLCCNDNHAMTQSFQVGFDIENREIQLGETFARLCILQICSYHLLGSQIINKRLKYRSEHWGNYQPRNTELKVLIRENIKRLKNILTRDGILLLHNYKSNWKFNSKTVTN